MYVHQYVVSNFFCLSVVLLFSPSPGNKPVDESFFALGGSLTCRCTYLSLVLKRFE